MTRRALKLNLARAAILLALLLAWEFLPKIQGLRDVSSVFDPFFVSSPTKIAERIGELATGADGGVLVWSYIWPTVYAALAGTALGMIFGAALGLLLSNFSFLSDVLRPYVVAANATPRVALIPIIVLLFGPTLTASIVVSFLVVFFIAFFNAYEGGITVAPHLLENARLLGANRWRVLAYIRMPYALAWTLAGLPLAVTFAIISVVTAEILTGTTGMGSLLQASTTTAESALTFAVVIVLAIIGVAIVVAADAMRNRVLHWWGK